MTADRDDDVVVESSSVSTEPTAGAVSSEPAATTSSSDSSSSSANDQPNYSSEQSNASDSSSPVSSPGTEALASFAPSGGGDSSPQSPGATGTGGSPGSQGTQSTSEAGVTSAGVVAGTVESGGGDSTSGAPPSGRNAASNLASLPADNTIAAGRQSAPILDTAVPAAPFASPGAQGTTDFSPPHSGSGARNPGGAPRQSDTPAGATASRTEAAQGTGDAHKGREGADDEGDDRPPAGRTETPVVAAGRESAMFAHGGDSGGMPARPPAAPSAPENTPTGDNGSDNVCRADGPTSGGDSNPGGRGPASNPPVASYEDGPLAPVVVSPGGEQNASYPDQSRATPRIVAEPGSAAATATSGTAALAAALGATSQTGTSATPAQAGTPGSGASEPEPNAVPGHPSGSAHVNLLRAMELGALEGGGEPPDPDSLPAISHRVLSRSPQAPSTSQQRESGVQGQNAGQPQNPLNNPRVDVLREAEHAEIEHADDPRSLLGLSHRAIEAQAERARPHLALPENQGPPWPAPGSETAPEHANEPHGDWSTRLQAAGRVPSSEALEERYSNLTSHDLADRINATSGRLASQTSYPGREADQGELADLRQAALSRIVQYLPEQQLRVAADAIRERMEQAENRGDVEGAAHTMRSLSPLQNEIERREAEAPATQTPAPVQSALSLAANRTANAIGGPEWLRGVVVGTYGILELPMEYADIARLGYHAAANDGWEGQRHLMFSNYGAEQAGRAGGDPSEMVGPAAWAAVGNVPGASELISTAGLISAIQGGGPAQDRRGSFRVRRHRWSWRCNARRWRR